MRCSVEWRRGEAETSGRAKQVTGRRAEREREQCRETRAEQMLKDAEVQRRKGAEVQRRKGAKTKIVSLCEERKENGSRNAGKGRSYIGSATASDARGDCSHAHTRRDALLAFITPLIQEAQARGCARHARAQRRKRGITQACSIHRERHVMKAAYT